MDRKQSFFRRYIGEILSFFLPIGIFLLWTLSKEEFAVVSSDARLYLSIPDNFITTGHWIQTSRPIEGFVVPFGFPLILLFFRALGLGPAAVVVFQHILVGGESQLLYLCEKKRFGAGGFAPVLYCIALARAWLELNYVYLEFSFLFFLCWILYLLSREDLSLTRKLTGLNIAGFCAFAIRPVLIIVFLPILGYTLWSVIRGRFPVRRTAWLAAIFLSILGINLLVNHRETGHWVFMENYSGSDMYTANNPHTIPEYFASWRMDSFVGEEYYEIKDDPNLDFTEKNDAFKKAAREWIMSDFPRFAENTAIKFVVIFLNVWLYVPLAGLLCGLLSLWDRTPAERKLLAAEIAANLLIAAATSVGLIMVRYTIPIWPLCTLHLCWGAHTAIRLVFRKRNSREEQNAS